MPVAVTVGPWTHTQLMTKGAPTVIRESLDWLGAHLAGTGRVARKPVRDPRQRARMAGPARLAARDARAGAVSAARRPARRHGARADTAPASSFTYNPADPTPTIGGRLLSPEGGYRNDTRLAQRPDVLTFTGDAADRRSVCRRKPGHRTVAFVRQPATTTCSSGSARSTPRADPATSATDICARHRIPRNVRIELDAVAHRFPAGSRIRVLIAGGSHPRFARNLGTGEPTDQRAAAGVGHAHRAPRRGRHLATGAARGPDASAVSRLR